ncbi:hypothetical protein GCM10009544_33120 [Streptomyces stramineus]|uniref:Agmatine deiminase n=1 Tax=Streptomyces stramineus TaxID=173861 RepID=A0ABP3K1L4_9ACTN
MAAVRRDVAAIACTVAAYKPVLLLTAAEDAEGTKKACGGGIKVTDVPADDLWLRDYGPTFVIGPDGRPAGIDCGFNGWGGRQEHPRDGLVARRVLGAFGVPRVGAPLVAEGGSLGTDGEGTLLVTESSLVNDNRNPGRSRDDIEKTLQKLLGIRKVIWLAGVRGEDITDCHVDALARFAAPGPVVLSNPPPGSSPTSGRGSSRPVRPWRRPRTRETGHRRSSNCPSPTPPSWATGAPTSWAAASTTTS